MSVELRVGPLLRRVSESTATIWVETSAPGTVTVIADSANRAEKTDSADMTDSATEQNTPHTGEVRADSPTFTVHGHHYAVVDVRGLPPGSALPYRVLVDDHPVWPLPDSDTPPSLLRTRDPDAPPRILFGSCLTTAAHTEATDAKYGPDMLLAHASRLARRRREAGGLLPDEPSVMLLIGDQVYADEIQPEMAAHLRAHRAEAGTGRTSAVQPPSDEVVFFDEYAELYRRAWTVPEVRWLLSTVPTLMMFDDHDIRDDWNTSGAWRRTIAATPWWRDRVTSGIGAYWVYQHLGNLTPGERAADPVARSVLADDRADSGAALDDFAWRADQEPESYLWSYRLDLGTTRVLAVDTRCSRRVEDDTDRDILGARGAAWVDDNVTGGVDHLVIACSLPFLLPRGVHNLEAWNEAVCAGRWGQGLRGLGERLRQAVDLEHWAAFQRSFTHVTRAVLETSAGRRGPSPASVLFLGGDVHFSYLAHARPTAAHTAAHTAAPARAPSETTIAQLVCSPIRNRLPRPLRLMTRLAASGLAAAGTRPLTFLARVPRPDLRWRLETGPDYRNSLATLLLAGRRAEVVWEHATPSDASGVPRPRESTRRTLTT